MIGSCLAQRDQVSRPPAASDVRLGHHAHAPPRTHLPNTRRARGVGIGARQRLAMTEDARCWYKKRACVTFTPVHRRPGQDALYDCCGGINLGIPAGSPCIAPGRSQQRNSAARRDRLDCGGKSLSSAFVDPPVPGPCAAHSGVVPKQHLLCGSGMSCTRCSVICAHTEVSH